MKKNVLGYMRNMARLFRYKLLWKYFSNDIKEYKNIPIIINNFNRLECLSLLVSRLERDGYKNIYIIDNNSTYPPLLEYYQTLPYKIFYLKQNVGYLSLWKTGLFKQFKRSYYVYTDSDVIPSNISPSDYIEHFYRIMQKYKNAQKVGFGLRLDNLPDTYMHKNEVIKWENQFFKIELDEKIYKAVIDTTFALYRPYVHGPANFYALQIRTGYPYLAEHHPWYQDSANLSEEDIFYKNSIETSTHWSAK